MEFLRKQLHRLNKFLTRNKQSNTKILQSYTTPNILQQQQQQRINSDLDTKNKQLESSIRQAFSQIGTKKDINIINGDVNGIINNAQKSTVSIINPDKDKDGKTQNGTGIILNKEGYIVITKHTIKTNPSGKVIVRLNDEDMTYRNVEGTVSYVDPVYDLAFIKINSNENLKIMEFSKTPLKKSDNVIAIGDSGARDKAYEGDKNKFGVLQEAIIEKKSNGKYYNDLTKQEILIKTIVTKDGDKYKDSNGQLLTKKGNEFYYTKGNKKLEGDIIITDGQKHFDKNQNRLNVTTNKNKIFLNGLEIKDSLSVTPWVDKPNANDFYIDVSMDDAFITIEKENYKNIRNNSEIKNGQKIYYDDGFIDSNNKTYRIGNYMMHSVGASLGKFENSNNKIQNEEGMYQKSNLTSSVGASGGALLNDHGKCYGVLFRADENTYSIPTEYLEAAIKRAEAHTSKKIDIEINDKYVSTLKQTNPTARTR